MPIQQGTHAVFEIGAVVRVGEYLACQQQGNVRAVRRLQRKMLAFFRADATQHECIVAAGVPNLGRARRPAPRSGLTKPG